MHDGAAEVALAGRNGIEDRVLRTEDEPRARAEGDALGDRNPRAARRLEDAPVRTRATIQHVGAAEKAGDEEIGRPLVEVHGRSDLLHRAFVHHRDPVADRVRFLLVVGHEDGGDAQALLQVAQFAPDLDAQLGV